MDYERILLTGILFCAGAGWAGAAAPLRVVVISGSGEYETREFLPGYAEYLQDRYNIQVTLFESNCKGNKPGDSVPGLEALKDCDTVLIYTRRLEIDGEQLKLLKE